LYSINQGARWLAGLQIFEILVQSSMKIVLAWILTPEDFGVIGTALLISGFAQATSQTGVVAALIQKKDLISDHLNSGWTIEVIRGLILYAIIFFITPFYITYMTGELNNDYVSLVRVVGLIVLLDSLKNIGIIFFDKTLNFRKVFLLQSISLIAKSISSLLLCLYLESYWGIAYGMLIGSIFLFFASYFLSDYRMRFIINYKIFKELMSFGIWVFFYTIIGFIILKLPEFIALKQLGIKELGILQMAIFIGMIFRNTISEIQNRIVFPLASDQQNSTAAIKKLYLTSFEISLLIYLPAGIGLSYISADLVQFIFPAQWFDVSYVLGILAIAGIFGSLTRVIEQIYKGVGAVKEILIFCLLSLGSLAYCLYFIFEITIAGIGYSILVSSIMHFLIIFIHSLIKFKIKLSSLFVNTPFIVLPSIIMILILVYLDPFLVFSGVILLVTKIGIGIFTFAASILVLFSIFRKKFISNLLKNEH
jgi:O-antigen/teichoic acid export membrane protein|tara:strand:+ start:8087 stop:9523 length:1437 start_codon:yes stop_codon:yes gene_type:complete